MYSMFLVDGRNLKKKIEFDGNRKLKTNSNKEQNLVFCRDISLNDDDTEEDP